MVAAVALGGANGATEGVAIVAFAAGAAVRTSFKPDGARAAVATAPLVLAGACATGIARAAGGGSVVAAVGEGGASVVAVGVLLEAVVAGGAQGRVIEALPADFARFAGEGVDTRTRASAIGEGVDGVGVGGAVLDDVAGAMAVGIRSVEAVSAGGAVFIFVVFCWASLAAVAGPAIAAGAVATIKRANVSRDLNGTVVAVLQGGAVAITQADGVVGVADGAVAGSVARAAARRGFLAPTEASISVVTKDLLEGGGAEGVGALPCAGGEVGVAGVGARCAVETSGELLGAMGAVIAEPLVAAAALTAGEFVAVNVGGVAAAVGGDGAHLRANGVSFIAIGARGAVVGAVVLLIAGAAGAASPLVAAVAGASRDEAAADGHGVAGAVISLVAGACAAGVAGETVEALAAVFVGVEAFWACRAVGTLPAVGADAGASLKVVAAEGAGVVVAVR